MSTDSSFFFFAEEAFKPRPLHIRKRSSLDHCWDLSIDSRETGSEIVPVLLCYPAVYNDCDRIDMVAASTAPEVTLNKSTEFASPTFKPQGKRPDAFSKPCSDIERCFDFSLRTEAVIEENLRELMMATMVEETIRDSGYDSSLANVREAWKEELNGMSNLKLTELDFLLDDEMILPQSPPPGLLSPGWPCPTMNNALESLPQAQVLQSVKERKPKLYLESLTTDFTSHRVVEAAPYGDREWTTTWYNHTNCDERRAIPGHVERWIEEQQAEPILSLVSPSLSELINNSATRAEVIEHLIAQPSSRGTPQALTKPKPLSFHSFTQPKYQSSQFSTDAEGFTLQTIVEDPALQSIKFDEFDPILRQTVYRSAAIDHQAPTLLVEPGHDSFGEEILQPTVYNPFAPYTGRSQKANQYAIDVENLVSSYQELVQTGFETVNESTCSNLASHIPRPAGNSHSNLQSFGVDRSFTALAASELNNTYVSKNPLEAYLVKNLKARTITDEFLPALDEPIEERSENPLAAHLGQESKGQTIADQPVPTAFDQQTQSSKIESETYLVQVCKIQSPTEKPVPIFIEQQTQSSKNPVNAYLVKTSQTQILADKPVPTPITAEKRTQPSRAPFKAFITKKTEERKVARAQAEKAALSTTPSNIQRANCSKTTVARARAYLKKWHLHDKQQEQGYIGSAENMTIPIQMNLKNHAELSRDYFMPNCDEHRQCHFELALRALEGDLPALPRDKDAYRQWAKAHQKVDQSTGGLPWFLGE